MFSMFKGSQNVEVQNHEIPARIFAIPLRPTIAELIHLLSGRRGCLLLFTFTWMNWLGFCRGSTFHFRLSTFNLKKSVLRVRVFGVILVRVRVVID